MSVKRIQTTRLKRRTLEWLVIVCVLLPAKTSPAQVGSSQNNLPTRPVKLSLIVTEGADSVDDVRQEDIEVIDEGTPQKLTLFAKDIRPVRCAVVVDTSESFRPLLVRALRSVTLLIQGNRSDDEMMLIRFISSDRIEKIQDFTSDKKKLLSEPLSSFSPVGGQSAVVDAVYTAVQETAAYNAGGPDVRRAVVLISDGEDRASFFKEEALIKLLREKDVQLFIIGIVSKLDDESGLIRLSPRKKAERLLNRIAEESGGRVFFPDDEKAQLEATNAIIHDLHSQFIVGFNRSVWPKEKGFRSVKVKVSSAGSKKRKAITRTRYPVNTP